MIGSKFRPTAAIFSIFVWGAMSCACHAQYTFRNVDFPGAMETIVNGINNQGAVVGQYGDIEFTSPSSVGNRGFVFDGQTYETIHVPGAQSTSARGINDDGVIVGGYVTSDGLTRGFIFDGSTYSDIVTPFSDGATAADINVQGQVVGTFTNDNFQGDAHGFLLSLDEFQRFDFPDAITTHMVGINDSGALAGYYTTDEFNRGFILQDRRLTQIAATSLTQATGLNNEGETVGFFLNGTSIDEVWHQSFIFDSQTQAFSDSDIALPGPDCSFSLNEPISHCIRIVTDINSDGTIAGYFDNDDGVFHGFTGTLGGPPLLQAGDSDRDLDFDQADLVQVLVAAKYLTGQPATWGEGDWDGAPNGTPENPPLGDGLFDQRDIIAAAAAERYLTGPYVAKAAIKKTGNDGSFSLGYDSRTGELFLRGSDAQSGLTSIEIDSTAGIFQGERAEHLSGAFDHLNASRLFKVTFGSSFGSLSFGDVALPGLSEEFLRSDISVQGSLSGGRTFDNMRLVYVPEPGMLVLLLLAIPGLRLFVNRFFEI